MLLRMAFKDLHRNLRTFQGKMEFRTKTCKINENYMKRFHHQSTNRTT